MKKTLAILLALAMVFSTLTVAFAEGTIGADAQSCVTLNMIQGEGNGVTADYLAKTPTRLQAAIMVLRLKGLEDEALAYTGTDNFADANQVAWAGGKAIMGYLKTHPELGWVGDQGKFNPYGEMIAKDYYKVMLETLGYKQNTTEVIGDFTYPGTIEFAAKQGLTKIATVTNFTNNDVAIATVEALKAKVKGSEKTLALSLIESKVITEAAATEAGVYTPAPVVLAVESIKALNNKQVQFTFNKEMDGTSAETASFYQRNGVALNALDLVTLQADKKSVVITLNSAEANQTKVKYSVKSDIKAADGDKLAEAVEKEIQFVDVTIPTFVKAEQFGPKAIKVYFSEPITATSAGFKVDNGTVYPSVGTIDNEEYSVVLNFGTSLAAGEHKLVINPSTVLNVKDAANLYVDTIETTFNMAADETAPTIVSATAVSQKVVDVKFSEPIDPSSLPSLTDVYHTVSSYAATSIVMKTGTTDTLRITFNNNPMPAGSMTLYFKKESVSDLFGNLIPALSTTVDVSVDTTKPTASVTVEDDNTLSVVWSENVTGSTAEDNYLLKDAAGVVLKSEGYTDANGNVVGTLSYDAAEYTTTIDFGSNHLPAGSYILTISGVQDRALIANTMDTVSVNLTVTDNTKPTVTGTASLAPATATEGQKIVITFSESMDATSITTKANYILNGAALPSGTTLAAGVDNKSVIITLPLTTTITTAATVQVGQVTDAVGNKTAALATSVSLTGSTTVATLNFRAIATDTVTFEVGYPLASINATAFTVNGASVASATYENKTLLDGTTYGALVTLKVASANKWAVDATPSVVIGSNAGSDALGRTIVAGTSTAQDRMAPTVAKYTTGEAKIYAKDLTGPNSKIDTIEILYNEDLFPASVSTGTYVVDGYTITNVAVGAGSKTYDKVTLTVTEKSTADTAAAPKVKQVAEIKDNSTQKNVKAIDTDFIDSIDATVPTLDSATIATVAGTNNDVLTLTFSEALDQTRAEAAAVLDDITVNGSAVSAGTGESATLSDNGKVLTVVLGSDLATNAAFTVVYTNPNDNATELIDASLNANEVQTTTLTGFVTGEVADTTAPGVALATDWTAAEVGASTDTITLTHGSALTFGEKVKVYYTTTVAAAGVPAASVTGVQATANIGSDYVTSIADNTVVVNDFELGTSDVYVRFVDQAGNASTWVKIN